MGERLPIKGHGQENPVELFAGIATLRDQAKSHRAAYRETVDDMDNLCQQLRGVELLITGRLHGRGGITVYSDDPTSQVEGLHIRVGSARMDIYEGHSQSIADELPFIEIVARTVDENELVCARLGVGDFGVTAELVTSDALET